MPYRIWILVLTIGVQPSSPVHGAMTRKTDASELFDRNES